MKHTLKVQYYLRYADDFIIVHRDKKYLEDLIGKIKSFLNLCLKIDLHPQKIQIRKFRQGIDFLGYICFPNYKIIRTKTKKRMFKKLNLRQKEMKDTLQSLQSYWGMLKHGNSWKIVKKLIRQFINPAT